MCPFQSKRNLIHSYFLGGLQFLGGLLCTFFPALPFFLFLSLNGGVNKNFAPFADFAHFNQGWGDGVVPTPNTPHIHLYLLLT
jgi:hypothetical protein